MHLKKAYSKFAKEIKVYKLVSQDKRTPKLGKFFLSLALGYLLLPFDLIPDFIPVLGHLDDAIIIPVLIYIALKLVPKEVVQDNRKWLKER